MVFRRVFAVESKFTLCFLKQLIQGWESEHAKSQNRILQVKTRSCQWTISTMLPFGLSIQYSKAFTNHMKPTKLSH